MTTVAKTKEQWAEVIRQDQDKAVSAVVATGQHLIEAKAELVHGEWLPMLELAGMSPDAAQRLMAIARHPALSKTEHARHLPSSWDTLYRLTKLEPEQIEAAIADGKVTAATTRPEAKALVQEFRAPEPEPESYEWFVMEGRRAMAKLRDNLLKAHRGEAWRALGYDSFTEYAEEEFGFSADEVIELMTWRAPE